MGESVRPRSLLSIPTSIMYPIRALSIPGNDISTMQSCEGDVMPLKFDQNRRIAGLQSEPFNYLARIVIARRVQQSLGHVQQEYHLMSSPDRLSIAATVYEQGYSFLVLLLMAVLLPSLSAFLGAFFKRKGENLASKGDIEELTKAVKSVEHEFNREIEDLKGHHQVRTAAAERRLQVHQEAYTLWNELLHHVHKSTIEEVVVRCQEWYFKNCLYLSAEANDAFRRAYTAALNHRQYLHSPDSRNLIERNWGVITAAEDAIRQAVELPPLGEPEHQALRKMVDNFQTETKMPEGLE